MNAVSLTGNKRQPINRNHKDNMPLLTACRLLPADDPYFALEIPLLGLIAILAINGPVPGRLKRNFAFLPASGANRFMHFLRAEILPETTVIESCHVLSFFYFVHIYLYAPLLYRGLPLITSCHLHQHALRPYRSLIILS